MSFWALLLWACSAYTQTGKQYSISLHQGVKEILEQHNQDFQSRFPENFEISKGQTHDAAYMYTKLTGLLLNDTKGDIDYYECSLFLCVLDDNKVFFPKKQKEALSPSIENILLHFSMDEQAKVFRKDGSLIFKEHALSVPATKKQSSSCDMF
ncbi:MAG: hypothetical protein A2Y14_01245 [Verrucomicrobia bacterium GWF2_51_19]|nr:MAG: hypothetical protein A2Y14_01245 [Verrucomicrobia bacterium GWF2_51_19]HCJ11511.1 hypothetical protein [Opitutae bacterium]